MLLACSRCGTLARPGSRECAVCGTPIFTTIASTPGPVPSSHTGARRPALAPRARLRSALVPMVGFLFGTLFLIGFAQLLAIDGIHRFGPIPLSGLVLCGLVMGALVAQRMWVNGEVWGGLRGMLLWGGLTGLLALNRLFPWGLLIIPIWLMLWLYPRR